MGAKRVKYDSSGNSALPKLSRSPTRRLPDHGARQAPQAAHDDDDEGIGQHLEIRAGIDAEESARDDPAQRGQAGAQREDAEGHRGHVDAHAAGHLRVVDGGAHHGPDARALEKQPQGESRPPRRRPP